mmetsp:Transcript_18244/g.24039  ORF Transcript_18244/g.24039 Transcript_18244/m.24039 type:complete len:85 (-) Transcript_18244:124-378(-)
MKMHIQISRRYHAHSFGGPLYAPTKVVPENEDDTESVSGQVHQLFIFSDPIWHYRVGNLRQSSFECCFGLEYLNQMGEIKSNIK